MASNDPSNRETTPLSDSPIPDQPGADLIDQGKIIGGRYLIEKELGSGGIGVVYLAHDQKLHHSPVVIKVLRENLPPQSKRWIQKKFKGEIAALSRIDHPGVVRALDVGDLPDGRSYLVMQYVSGVSLRSIIPAQGMELERVGKLVRQIGQALTAAHEQGVIHRDLKPENIMLQQSGDEEYAKLIDFGIATVLEKPGWDDTPTTMVAGTIYYMAPEQLHGRPTPASDIYVLGIIAYEIVTGCLPFNPDTPHHLLELQRAGVRIKPSDLRPSLPAAAQAVILKALSFAEPDRFARAKDFGDALASALSAGVEEVTSPEDAGNPKLPARTPMTPERWLQVKDLFDTVKEMALTERVAYLAAADGSDVEVCAEARKLLTAFEQAGDFIEKPAVAHIAGLPIDILQPSAIGRRLGPYQIVREIGRGGMGVVYLAHRADDEYQGQVAIKLAWPGQESGEMLRRFRQERQILANLDHPNIARLLDGGTTEDGLPYVVMEYIAGVPITDYCDEHQLSITERLKLFLTICSAAAYAHQNLVIHRDLKPSNILVAKDGTVKLLDFGIAKLLTPDDQTALTALTRSGLHLMTPDYASPEQVRGEAITTASDVYSLGVVLYELLTGHRPYRFKNRMLPELTRVICEEEPERPSIVISRVETDTGPDGAPRQQQTLVNVSLVTLPADEQPTQAPHKQRTPESVSLPREGRPEKLRGRLAGDVDNIVLMALRKDVPQRYQSVEQLSADIRRHLQGEQVIARKDTLGYRVGKFARRHRVGVGTTAALMLMLIAGIVTTSWQARKAIEQARINRRLLYAAQMNLAEQAWETTNIARLRDLVEGQWPQMGEEDLRGFEWYYLWRLYHHNGELFSLRHAKEVWSVAFSPDGGKLAAGDEDGKVKLWDTATGKELAVLSGHEKGISSVAWSRDGQKLATASYGQTAKLWNAATGQALATLKGHTKRVNAAAFSPDGKKLATGSDDGTMKLWDATTGSEMMTIQSHAIWIRSLAFSPDGRKLATGLAGLADQPGVKLWDAATGQELRAFNGQGSVRSVAFSPDGNRLATGSNDRTVRLWDVNTGQELASFKGHTSEVHAMAWSPDGQRLVTGSADRTVKLWDTTTRQELTTLKGHFGQVWSVAFSPDGRKLATCSDDFTARLWDIATALELTTLKSDQRVSSVTFSPDGRKLVTGGSTSYTAKLWDAITGQQLATLEGHTSYLNSVAFSHDGKRIATGSADRTVKLWDAATGNELMTLKGHLNQILSVAFSPDSQRLVTGSADHTAKLWEAATGQEIATLKGHTTFISSVAFSPDGQRLATGSYDHTAKLWDAATGRELATLKGHIKPILSLAFSPDGKTLATGSADSTVKLWQVSTGQELATFKGHAGHVRSVAFSLDGKRLATGSSEGLVRLWDVATGQELIALKGHTDVVTSVAFSPDGQTLVSGSMDTTVRFWRAATGPEVLAWGKK